MKTTRTEVRMNKKKFRAFLVRAFAAFAAPLPSEDARYASMLWRTWCAISFPSR